MDKFAALDIALGDIGREGLQLRLHRADIEIDPVDPPGHRLPPFIEDMGALLVQDLHPTAEQPDDRNGNADQRYVIAHGHSCSIPRLSGPAVACCASSSPRSRPASTSPSGSGPAPSSPPAWRFSSPDWRCLRLA